MGGWGIPIRLLPSSAVIVTFSLGFCYAQVGFLGGDRTFHRSGIALIHTYSRGGLIAAFAGLIPVIIFAPRPWPRSRIIAIVGSIWIIVGSSLYLQAHERYMQRVGQEDRSITNRLDIWKSAPDMIFGCPSGLGIGKAEEAYMNWYQPMDRSENLSNAA